MRLVSLYIGLQAVFIIFHYSCFMHDCARRAVIGSVGAEANQRASKTRAQGVQTVQALKERKKGRTKERKRAGKKKENTSQMSRPFPFDRIFPGRTASKKNMANVTGNLRRARFWVCRALRRQPGTEPDRVRGRKCSAPFV